MDELEREAAAKDVSMSVLREEVAALEALKMPTSATAAGE